MRNSCEEKCGERFSMPLHHPIEIRNSGVLATAGETNPGMWAPCSGDIRHAVPESRWFFELVRHGHQLYPAA